MRLNKEKLLKDILELNFTKGVSNGEVDIKDLFDIGIKEKINESNSQKNNNIEKYKTDIFDNIWNIFVNFNIKDNQTQEIIKILNLQELLDNYKSINFSDFFNKNFEIIGDEINIIGFNNFSLNDYECNFSLNFENCKFTRDVEFKNCTLKKDLIFKNCNFGGNNIEIRDCKIEGELKIDYLENVKKIFIFADNNAVISLNQIFGLEQLHIYKKNKQDKYKKIELRNINFSDGVNNSYIINDCSIEKLDVEFSTNLSKKLIFQNLNLDFLKIKNTDLGKTTFNGVKINKLYLENATLNNCIFNGVEFKNYELEKGKLSNKQLKDNYRQLKYVMDKNGNITEANKFFEKEMEYYGKTIDSKKIFKKGWYRKILNETFIGEQAKLIGEKINILFGKAISDFGNNWLRPLFLIVLLSILGTDIMYLYDNIGGIFKFIKDIQVDLNILIENKIWKIVEGFYYFDLILIIIFLFKKFPFWFIFITALLIQVLTDYKILDNFAKLLYPLYGFKKDFIDNLNFLELIGLIFYKIIYGILLWHLIIALKRTTKR